MVLTEEKTQSSIVQQTRKMKLLSAIVATVPHVLASRASYDAKEAEQQALYGKPVELHGKFRSLVESTIAEKNALLLSPSMSVSRSHSVASLREGTLNQGRHRRISTEYNQACSDTSIMYQGTGQTASCVCEPEVENLDRIVCQVGGISCDPTLGICLGETDVWGFDETNGQLVARSTCLNCVELGVNATTCNSWQDTCFYSEFNQQDDMSRCLLIYSELSTDSNLVGCDDCVPCLEDDGDWGMNFDCAFFSSQGQCVSPFRIGLHPFDNVVADGESTQVNPDPEQDPDQDPKQNSDTNKSDSKSDDDDDMLKLFIIVGAVAVGLTFVCGLMVGFCLCTRQKSRSDRDAANSPPPPTMSDLEGPAAAMPGVGYTTAHVYGSGGEETGAAVDYNGFGQRPLHSINIAEKLDTTDSTGGNTADDSYAANL